MVWGRGNSEKRMLLGRKKKKWHREAFIRPQRRHGNDIASVVAGVINSACIIDVNLGILKA